MSGISDDDRLARAADGDAQAQYELGREYAGRQSLTRARRRFREAADRGHAGAMCELGLLDLFGVGADPDPSSAARHLRAAESAGSAEAAYQLALIGFCGVLEPFDLVRMAERLRFAAQEGHPAALRAMALVLRADGDHGASDLCLRHAAARGDAVATLLLERRHGATPTATPAPLPDPLPALPLPRIDVPRPASRTRWSSEPLVETIDDVLDADECAFVVAMGAPFLTASLGVDSTSGTLMRSELRTSSNMVFHSFREDFALRWLQWRLVRLTDATLDRAEHTTLLRYLPGEEYRPHRDYLPPASCGAPGQRVNTVFCFLGDVERGGDTAFPLLDVTIAPKLGRAVYFKNLTRDGAPDPRTLHAGLPVVSGEKWLATLWTRERRFRDW